MFVCVYVFIKFAFVLFTCFLQNSSWGDASVQLLDFLRLPHKIVRVNSVLVSFMSFWPRFRRPLEAFGNGQKLNK